MPLITKVFIMRLFIAVYILILILIFMAPSLANGLLILFSGTISFAGFLIAANVYLKTKELHVLIYIVAYGAVQIGALIQMLIWGGFLPGMMGYGHITFISSAVENILMLMAMGYKVYGTQREKIHGYNEMAKVFYPHQISQIKRGSRIEDTMPIGENEACVISFDIIGSSKVKHEAFADLIEDFMGKCRNQLMEGYDEKTLVSSGYMIKEMGDGFICSVGFPFKQTGELKSVCAVKLAEQMINEFSSMVIKMGASSPVYCCAGVAKGLVRSYFSKSGRIRDDLWGPAIILAVRYESTRKLIFDSMQLQPCSLIILQETVYETLSPEKKQEYKIINLIKAKIRIKDDPSAENLAFKRFPYGEQDSLFEAV